MKIAVVHDWLNSKDGGAEKVLRDILAIYPSADVFTLLYNKKKFGPIVRGRKIQTSFLQFFPAFLKKRPQYLLPFIRSAVSKLDLSGYDLVISSSGAWSKNIKLPPGAHHVCYCHSPARMLWVDWPMYLDSFNFLGFRLIPGSKLWITKVCSKLRLWDYYQSEKVDQFVANSKNVAVRIKKFYHRDSIVIYPGTDVAAFRAPDNLTKGDYFLVVSTLAKYKNLDHVILAFQNLKQKLVIAGDGSDRTRLEKLAKNASNIEFLGYVSGNQKIELMQKAKCLIFPSNEDFGITPVEAMAAGTPVIALVAGGALETVNDKTGIFYKDAEPHLLQEAITSFDSKHFAKDNLTSHAQQFSTSAFNSELKQVIGRYINE